MDVCFTSWNVWMNNNSVMLGIRSKQKADDSVPNEDALKMFHEYIGAVEIDMTEHNELKKSI